jgi:hypothetical protein
VVAAVATPVAIAAASPGGGTSPVLPAHTFSITGSMTGLYPGETAPLSLTVHNSEHFAITVTSISTDVGAPGGGCAAANLTVGQFVGALPVAATGSAHVSVPITLVHAAPDACQGAVFPLTYTGQGRKP